MESKQTPDPNRDKLDPDLGQSAASGQPRRHTDQFSIRKMFLWTAIAAGGGRSRCRGGGTDWDGMAGCFYLGIYLVLVCGILSFIREPKSFDVLFPTGMTGFCVLTILMMFIDDPPVGMFIIVWCAIVPCAILLLVLNVLRIKKRKFSLSILVYQWGSFLLWVGFWFLAMSGPA